MNQEPDPIESVKAWLESLVIQLNLCPFANQTLTSGRIRFTLTQSTNELDLLTDLNSELNLLQDSTEIETTLLIHPAMLQDFDTYNDFLTLAEELLARLNMETDFQIASFHPAYQFAGSNSCDIENYTNRSPYPLLHILRQASVEKAITDHPDISKVPLRNIELLKELGEEEVLSLFHSCYREKHSITNLTELE